MPLPELCYFYNLCRINKFQSPQGILSCAEWNFAKPSGCRFFKADARMMASMTANEHDKPRIGVPWRTTADEGKPGTKLEDYLSAVRLAGGEAVPVSLSKPEELEGLLSALDAFVLPGSPADVDPARYGSTDHGKCSKPDSNRERTDLAILEHAFSKGKPVLAICYGCQILNVHLHGTLTQDICSETRANVRHSKKDPPPTQSDPIHSTEFERDSRLAALAGSTRAEVNSSHHQAIERPGKNLRVTARSPEDGIIEGIEWTGGSNWVVGVQWHPERMFAADPPNALNPFALRLFQGFVAAARGVEAHKA